MKHIIECHADHFQNTWLEVYLWYKKLSIGPVSVTLSSPMLTSASFYSNLESSGRQQLFDFSGHAPTCGLQNNEGHIGDTSLSADSNPLRYQA